MTKIESIKNHQKVYYRNSILEKHDLSFSIVFQHLYYHITSNEKKKIMKAYKDNKYWYYGTYRQIASCTGLNVSSVEVNIKKIFKSGLIIEGNHNFIKTHARKWFTLGNIKEFNFNKEKPSKIMLDKFIDGKPQPSLVYKTLSFLMDSFGINNELDLTFVDISNFLKNNLTVRQVKYWSKKLVEKGMLFIKETRKKLSTFMFTNDVYSQNGSDKTGHGSDKTEGGITRKNKEVLKEVLKEQCNTRKRERCFSMKDLKELKVIEPSLAEGYLGHLLKIYSFEKLKSLIRYCQDRKPDCVGSYLRGFLRKDPEGNLPKKENIKLANEYFGKYEIFITQNYVRMTRDIELFFYSDIDVFKERFLKYIDKAVKKEGICGNHNKRLVEKLKSVNPYSVKSLNSYQVVVNSFNSQLTLDLYGTDTEKNLEELISREISFKEESEEKVSEFSTMQDLLDETFLDKILGEDNNIYEKSKYQTCG